jgi:hypothetical protein
MKVSVCTTESSSHSQSSRQNRPFRVASRNLDPIGYIGFFDGDMPGDNRLRVEAADNMTLSCLQERLNQLGQNVRIEVVA